MANIFNRDSAGASNIHVYPVLVLVPKSPPLGELAFEHLISTSLSPRHVSQGPYPVDSCNDVWSGIRSRIVHSNYIRYHERISSDKKKSCSVDTGKQVVITFHLHPFTGRS